MWAICDNRPSAKTRRSGYAQLHVCLRFFAVSDLFGCAYTDEKEASSIA